MNNLMGITVRPELVYDAKGNEWRERSLIAELKVKELEEQLDAVHPYLSHHRNCPMWRMAKGSDLCSCGLSAALQGDIETELKSGDQRVQIEIPDEINGEKE